MPRLSSALLSHSPAVLVLIVLTAPAAAQREHDEGQWRQARERLAQQLAREGVQDSRTLAAMRTVPRHEFVPPDYRALAYEDIPLPIGHDQTISQPAVVALMTQLIAPRRGKRVLEVGTGSGYQAAVLAQAGCRVWTIEIVEALAKEARDRLARLGYYRVEVRHGDGYAGWPDEAPFDAILVTAAADSIPPALLDQLASGGRLVMPVGDQASPQMMVLVQKDARGRLVSRQLFPVRFVPLLRGIR
jgi:protein-L-isoaspartate(D-aspartate) O-methyltransferase